MLLFSALVMIARWIAVRRHGKAEAVIATDWLKSDLNSDYLVFSAMIEASQTTLELIRITDTEEADNPHIQEEVYMYLQKMRYLFGDVAGFETLGYTKFALHWLKHEKIEFMLGKGSFCRSLVL